MNYLIKYFFFVLFFCVQFSYTQTVYEIDEYDNQTIFVCDGFFEDSNNSTSPAGNYLNLENYTKTLKILTH